MEENLTKTEISRSFIIPVLNFSANSPYNISTLLSDLENIPGEVICIFNSIEVFDKLHNHPRIDKYCFNNLNPGKSRSWNIGINMAEGISAFILNTDIHVLPSAVEQMETYLYSLNNAVIVGPQGRNINFEDLSIVKSFDKGTFNEPVQTHDVSGSLFAIHLDKYLKHHLIYDVQFSPCFYEEWDMGLQIIKAGLACYAVPVKDFEHHVKTSLSVNYFGRELTREKILSENRERFEAKWLQSPSDDKHPT
ncbi:MAG: hypothetical protein HON76_11440 [Candidatus Scalindua sp.]|mgnify:CR=1 FL=1|jgi:hypothetical protein|nr:hypothetical protein [Candidatus Scalindua sp.]MBT6046556.1 hypothetical protein [Candidatus Scalindua sp.]MBT6563126.1 hypothetical protein [Candidatus Scalindua sp.]MBT7213282.1 hypothetical protein [Candidatus Scalindua sp.]MBT7591055.1 hypothetical protein [Candidatus Scalindua sp.]